MKYIIRIDTPPLGMAWYKTLVGAHIVAEDTSDGLYFGIVGRVEYVIAKGRCTIIRELPDENPVVSEIINSTPDETAKLVSENSDLRAKIDELETELSAYRSDEKGEPQPFDYERAMKGDAVELHTEMDGIIRVNVLGRCSDKFIAVEDENCDIFKVSLSKLRMAAKPAEYVTKWVNFYCDGFIFDTKHAADNVVGFDSDRTYHRAFPIRVPKEK